MTEQKVDKISIDQFNCPMKHLPTLQFIENLISLSAFKNYNNSHSNPTDNNSPVLAIIKQVPYTETFKILCIVIEIASTSEFNSPQYVQEHLNLSYNPMYSSFRPFFNNCEKVHNQMSLRGLFVRDEKDILDIDHSCFAARIVI